MTESDRETEEHDGGDLGVHVPVSQGPLATDRRSVDRAPGPRPDMPSTEEAEFARQMELGRSSMRKHRSVLAALAK